jgi:hypothetical protein
MGLSRMISVFSKWTRLFLESIARLLQNMVDLSVIMLSVSGFNVPREIPDYLVAFLMMGHKRLGKNSIGYKLPESLYRNIYSFLKRKKRKNFDWISSRKKVLGIRLGISLWNFYQDKAGLPSSYWNGIDFLGGSWYLVQYYWYKCS